MKTLFFTLFIIGIWFMSCKKKDDQQPNNSQPVNTTVTHNQDSRLIGTWMLDSILNDTLMQRIHRDSIYDGPIGFVSDSIIFTTANYNTFGYWGLWHEYIQSYISWPGPYLWDNQHADSLSVYLDNYTNSINYGFYMSSSNHNLAIVFKSDKPYRFYYHKI